jgi:2-dehydropantoate 2-reductase
MEAVAGRGLRVTGIWGDHLFTGIDARTSADGLRRGDFDIVFIAVKSYDTAAALEAAAPVLDEGTLVCAYQNGLGNIERVAARFGWERTVGARVIYGVRVTEPGAINITVIASPTALGAPRPESPVERARELAAAMDAAGLPTIYSDRVETLLWAKVAYNCALNPLSALLDAPYGSLPEIPEARRIMDAAIDELYAVGLARGVLLDPPDADAYRELFYNRLVPPTAAHYASMHEDFARRRRTEIDALNGAIVRLGAECGVPCPMNAWLTDLIHAREAAMRLGT